VLAYHFEEEPTSGSTIQTTLRFVELVEGPAKLCRRYSFQWEGNTSQPRHWQPDESSTIALFRGETPPVEGSNASLIERNIADLLTMHIERAARVDNSMVIVLGPPLPKIVGRLAYRCINQTATVAFFTWPDLYQCGYPVPAPTESRRWLGPVPSFHDDAVLRTFYAWQSGGTPVRLDLLSQQFGSSSYSLMISTKTSDRVTLIDKLIAQREAISLPSGKRLYVPYELAVLSKSVRWSDEKFRLVLSQHSDALRKEIDSRLIQKVVDNGVSCLEPKTVAARLGQDASYAKEILYYELESEVADAGLRTGLRNFLRPRIRL